MDMSSRSSFSTQSSTSLQARQRAHQLTHTENGEVNQVSESSNVQGQGPKRIAASGAGQSVNLKGYRDILEGVKLPPVPGPVATSDRDSEAYLAATGQAPVVTAEQALQNRHQDSNTGSRIDSRYSRSEGGKVGEAEEGQKGEKGKKGKKAEATTPSSEKSMSGEALSKEDVDKVQKLKARDREVRTHEQAHVSAGGQHIRGGITYEYQQGPDGRKYAVGGHVDIDLSEAETPQATITKMQQVKRAALAPAEPSGADRSVAAAASQKEQRARSELLKEQKEKIQGQDGEKTGMRGRVRVAGSRAQEARNGNQSRDSRNRSEPTQTLRPSNQVRGRRRSGRGPSQTDQQVQSSRLIRPGSSRRVQENQPPKTSSVRNVQSLAYKVR